MNIIKVIEYANNFITSVNNYNNNEKPKSIKVIVGSSNFSNLIQSVSESVKNEIDIYREFKYMAFYLNNKVSYIGSDTKIWNLLLNYKTNETKIFMARIKGVYPFDDSELEKINYDNLIKYLFYEYGLVMVNREDEKNFEVFRKYEVTDVLIIGSSAPYKKLSKYFLNARMGVITHPSSKSSSKSNEKKQIYEDKNNGFIKQVSYYHNKHPITNFNNFIIRNNN